MHDVRHTQHQMRDRLDRMIQLLEEQNRIQENMIQLLQEGNMLLLRQPNRTN